MGIVSIVVKNLTSGGTLRVISRLAPAPEPSSTLVHSRTVLVAKHDLPPQSIHRLDQTRTGLVDKSQLM